MFLIFLSVEYSIHCCCLIARTALRLNYQATTFILPPQRIIETPAKGKTYWDKNYMFSDFRSLL